MEILFAIYSCLDQPLPKRPPHLQPMQQAICLIEKRLMKTETTHLNIQSKFEMEWGVVMED
ncbi:hypothetical protein VB834_29570 [Limnoraphis robusta Tam1]|uniref:Uncharacterized protein n=1 Tax=Limnoraphis robusta CCNP1315 TaxID=3110306 RepID=A0ABU5U3G5_9CYAN|nr:hypothetical protein [Limnoraphis robusta]MEA5500486.1 hypothetical protein [Limnoraphis robusta BA-68 BA1]MEA5521732.1 hypothetical protein [Limnoraphis robusta CCNP1315]MEA5543183.1 hypothetical protein [Limnoraphis robusta Tam1]MEA5547363.1 hypothetical protein [Limnoraphis robusta CCNP1324]